MFEARVGDMTNVLYRSLVGRHEGKKYVRDVGVDETILIMKWIVKKLFVRLLAESSDPR
jgi:hypothetical protein